MEQASHITYWQAANNTLWGGSTLVNLWGGATLVGGGGGRARWGGATLTEEGCGALRNR